MTHRAFQLFFHESYPQAVRFAQSRLGDRQLAEDIVQDVFVRIWERRDLMDTDRSPKAYLFKLVATAVIDHFRHEKVKRRHAEQVLSVEPSWAPAVDPVQEAEIYGAIDALPEKEATVFRLNRFAGMTYAETAQYLGVSQKTVEKHMSRALSRLGTTLRDFLVILVGLLVLGAAGVAYGQDRSLRGTMVSIQLEGLELRDALNAVATQVGAGIAYDDAMVDARLARNVCQACRLDALLQDLLSPHGLSYELLDGPVIVVVRGIRRTVTGRVVDAESGDPLPLAQVWTGSVGGVADSDGHFSLVVPHERPADVTVSFMGYQHETVRVGQGEALDVGTVRLMPRTIVVGEVTVLAEPVIPVSGDGSGARLMGSGTLGRIPSVGSDDPLQAVQWLPGLDNTAERAGELFVRGATPRTNLVTWDGIPVFTADHFFGMISTFSPQAVGEVRTYPRGVPAHLGGRAGTVVEMASPPGLGRPQVLIHSSVLVSGASARIPLGRRAGGWVSARRSTPAIEQQTAYSAFFDSAIGEEFQSNRPGFTFTDMSARLDMLPTDRHHVFVSLHTTDDGLDRFTNEEFTRLALVNEQTDEEEEENDNRGRGRGRGRGGDDGEDDIDDDEEDEVEVDVEERIVTEQERTGNDWSLTGAAVNWTARWTDGAPMHVQLTHSRSESRYLADVSEMAGDTLAFSERAERDHVIQEQAVRLRQDVPWQLGTATVGAFVESSRSTFDAVTEVNATGAVDSTSARDMTLMGGHVAQDIVWKRLRLQAGLRLTRLATRDAWFAAPRLSTDLTISRHLSAQLFWGQYHQYMLRSLDSDILVERRDSWTLVGPGQDPARSRQGGASLVASGRTWSMSADVWYRTSVGVPVLPEATPRADVSAFNGDETRTSGLDLGAQATVADVVGLVSYTYTRSEARSQAFPDIGWFSALSGRPHAVKGVLSVPVGRLTVGVSYSVASGRPVGVLVEPRRFVSSDGSQLLGSAAASLDGQRLAPYQRLDLDLEWTGRAAGLDISAAVSAANVLNRENVRYQRIVTDGDAVLLRDVPMLGFTPSATLRIGFYRP